MEAVRSIARVILGTFMIYAGTGHFTNTESFLAQVPPFLPAAEFIVYASGVVEIVLGLGLMFSKKYRQEFGIALAFFYIIIFPGNISQFLTGTPAFGLDSDAARAVRLIFQPVLIAWAIWSTNSWNRLKTIR